MGTDRLEPVASSRCSQRTRTASPPRAARWHGLAIVDARQPFAPARRPCAKRAHTAGEAPDDAVLPAHGLRDVDAGLLHLDAQRRTVGLVARSVECARVDQRLDGMQPMFRQVPPRLALDQHGRDAQLPGTDGGHIAAGTAADDQQFRCDFLRHRLTHKQQGRGFEQRARGLDELRGVHAIDHAVVERGREVHQQPAHHLPLRNMGRSTMRLTPTMATSGWLMTGVLAMPPSAPGW